MIIISDAICDVADEGALKVAKTLACLMKKAEPQTTVVSYKRKSETSDVHLKLNKFFINRSLFSLIKEKKEEIIYIPFGSNTTGSAIRLRILSLVCKKRIRVIFPLRHKMGGLQKFFLKRSRAEIIVLSEESYRFYKEKGLSPVYLKTGIDTGKFVPVDGETKRALREKYGIPADGQVVLHVGHLKEGRNMGKLLDISPDKTVLLVVSSVTEQDAPLKARLKARENIIIEERYIPSVEEIFALSDVYLFPVVKSEENIDVPLSVLEAAACNIPIVTTATGEIKSFVGKDGFYFPESLDGDKLNEEINRAIKEGGNPREAVLPYDWKNAAEYLLGGSKQ